MLNKFPLNVNHTYPNARTHTPGRTGPRRPHRAARTSTRRALSGLAAAPVASCKFCIERAQIPDNIYGALNLYALSP